MFELNLENFRPLWLFGFCQWALSILLNDGIWSDGKVNSMSGIRQAKNIILAEAVIDSLISALLYSLMVVALFCSKWSNGLLFPIGNWLILHLGLYLLRKWSHHSLWIILCRSRLQWRWLTVPFDVTATFFFSSTGGGGGCGSIILGGTCLSSIPANFLSNWVSFL